MEHLHKPVLLQEVLDSFAVFKERTDLYFYDATYGRGGHFAAIKKNYHPTVSVATDQDEQACAEAQKVWQSDIESGQVKILHSNFADFAFSEPAEKFHMILIDLGVSSPQLDQAERGFSFNKDGPLDMRMNQRQSQTAADIVNGFEAEELTELFKTYGEIPNPARVVRAIVNDRQNRKFTQTLELASLIERVDGWKKKGFHPATQYFMALRLVVNRELQVIEQALPQLISRLHDQGRISVISFHSLEDRIVKNIFKDATDGFAVNKKVIVPSEEECKINSRARSAKLRIFQKGAVPEKPDKFALRRALRKNDSNM